MKYLFIKQKMWYFWWAEMVWKFHTGQFQVHLPSSCEASIILSRVLGTSFDIRGRESECKPPSTSPTLELVPKSMLLGNLSDTILLHINKWNPCIFGCPPPNNIYIYKHLRCGDKTFGWGSSLVQHRQSHLWHYPTVLSFGG